MKIKCVADDDDTTYQKFNGYTLPCAMFRFTYVTYTDERAFICITHTNNDLGGKELYFVLKVYDSFPSKRMLVIPVARFDSIAKLHLYNTPMPPVEVEVEIKSNEYVHTFYLEHIKVIAGF